MLCSLPPTTESFLQNVLRAHTQLCDCCHAVPISSPCKLVLQKRQSTQMANERFISKNMDDLVCSDAALPICGMHLWNIMAQHHPNPCAPASNGCPKAVVPSTTLQARPLLGISLQLGSALPNNRFWMDWRRHAKNLLTLRRGWFVISPPTHAVSVTPAMRG